SLLHGLWYAASLVLGGVLVRLWVSGHGLSVQGDQCLSAVRASASEAPFCCFSVRAVCTGYSLSSVFSPLSSPSPGSLVQAALTQPDSKSVNVAGSVEITCSGSSYGYYGWFQQKTPGSAPVTVIYSNNQRPSGIPSQFSGSQSGSTATLTITGVQAEDEAVYYFGSHDSSAGAGVLARLWGSSHWLSVQGCHCLGVVRASRFPGPGSDYSAGLEVSEPGRHRADHLLREQQQLWLVPAEDPWHWPCHRDLQQQPETLGHPFTILWFQIWLREHVSHHRITESQNHRTVGVRRVLERSIIGYNPPAKAVFSEQAAQVGVQTGLEYLQRRSLHNLPRQPVPMLRHPHCEEVLSHVS
uniref:Ig-like domain-containing protein n=1 Tax=Anas platyrhynchos platyrhynchos TaxID=8840 RepID=A0A493TMW3_ANAPP